MRFLSVSDVRILDHALAAKQALVREVVLPYQWEILNDRVPGAEKSHAIHNFRVAAGQIEGERYGVIFLDSDLYKWLEAVAYCLMTARDERLEACADEAIALIAAAQREDGYLDTYYLLEKPDERWRNLREGHELYCAGHLIEAAVAYSRATGKRAFLDVAVRFADCIDRHFGEGKCRGYAGHPEIELALMRLYEETHEERYLSLTRFFISERGTGKIKYFAAETAKNDHDVVWPDIAELGERYAQWHAPVVDQRDADGHAVRAMYLYSAMCDLARVDGDAALKAACVRLFDSVTRRRMYITGGIGSSARGEQFTSDYDLPSDAAYAETCASVGLMRFARRMFELTGDMRCFDVWQLVFENTVEAGMGRDGRHFFYVNPLSSDPACIAANPALWHVAPSRQMWFGVACCPPNIARAVASLGGSLFARDAGTLYVLAHIAAAFHDGEISGSLTNEGDRYALTLSAPPCDIVLRSPEGFRLTGESRIRHAGGTSTYHYALEPMVRLMRAHPRVGDAAGKIAVMRGQTVYCLEQADNGGCLSALCLDPSVPLTEEKADFLPPSDVLLKGQGYRETAEGRENALYADAAPVYAPVALRFIPYREWNNRGEGEMRVWVREYIPRS